MLITDYTQVSELLTNNLFLLDGPTGTHSIQAKALIESLLKLINSQEFLENFDLRTIDQSNALATNDRILIGTTEGNQAISIQDFYWALIDEMCCTKDQNGNLYNKMKREIARSYDLGDHVTAEQYSEIKKGTFRGMYLGDYWTINGKRYGIVDFDYYYLNRPDAYYNMPYDHELLMFALDSMLVDIPWNVTNPQNLGYVSSTIRTDHLYGSIKETVEQAFGKEHIGVWHDWLQNSNSTNDAIICECSFELPNETMIYGWRQMDGHSNNNNVEYTMSDKQLALYQIGFRSYYLDRRSFWLRDIYTTNTVSCISGNCGTVHRHGVQTLHCVRPIFRLIQK